MTYVSQTLTIQMMTLQPHAHHAHLQKQLQAILANLIVLVCLHCFLWFYTSLKTSVFGICLYIAFYYYSWMTLGILSLLPQELWISWCQNCSNTTIFNHSRLCCWLQKKWSKLWHLSSRHYQSKWWHIHDMSVMWHRSYHSRITGAGCMYMYV